MLATALAAAGLSAGITAFGHELYYRDWVRWAGFGQASWQPRSGTVLDREIRAAVPLGSSRTALELLLHQRHVDYWYTSAHDLAAVAHMMSDGNSDGPLILWMRFHFDEHDALLSIDSRFPAQP